jgi:hypothetical protein
LPRTRQRVARCWKARPKSRKSKPKCTLDNQKNLSPLISLLRGTPVLHSLGPSHYCHFVGWDRPRTTAAWTPKSWSVRPRGPKGWCPHDLDIHLPVFGKFPDRHSWEALKQAAKERTGYDNVQSVTDGQRLNNFTNIRQHFWKVCKLNGIKEFNSVGFGSSIGNCRKQ